MEWLIKKSCCDKQDNKHILVLCDVGGDKNDRRSKE